MPIIPDGFGIVTGRSKERAAQLLAAARELDIPIDQIETRPTQGGYLVPQAVIDHLNASGELAEDFAGQREQAVEDRTREIADEKAGTSAITEPAAGETDENGVEKPRTTGAPDDVPPADEAEDEGPADGKPLDEATKPADAKADEDEKSEDAAPAKRTRASAKS
jgi:hypothetical protein